MANIKSAKKRIKVIARQLCYIWQSVSGDFFVILRHDKYTAYEKNICYDVAVAGNSRNGADSLEERSV